MTSTRGSCLLILAGMLLLPLFAWSPPTDQKVVFLLLGPPGSGKTTQAKNLSGAYDVPALTMSEILKKESGWVKTPLKKGLKSQIESGDLVNDEVANGLIAKYISQKKAEKGFILDGYPVTAKQAEYLDATLKERGLPSPVVIHLQVPDSVAVDRMNDRSRADDDPATIERRLSDYHRDAKLILERYGSQTKLIDGTKSPEAVWRAIQQALSQ